MAGRGGSGIERNSFVFTDMAFVMDLTFSDYRSAVVFCEKEIDLIGKCRIVFEKIISLFKCISLEMLDDETGEIFPDLRVLTNSEKMLFPGHNIHLLWIVGSAKNPEFKKSRARLFKTRKQKIYFCITISIDDAPDFRPLCDQESCFYIEDENDILNFIHDMTCLLSLPQLVSIDFSYFKQVFGRKKCRISGYEIAKSQSISRARFESSILGKQIAPASSIFVIAAFDRQLIDSVIIKTIDEIIQPIYRQADNNDNVPKLEFGDTGWPGYLDLNCSLRVTAVYL